MNQAHELVQNLLDFIDDSPSPWHAVASMENQLRVQGFECLKETEAWSLQPGERYYVIRDNSSIIAFVVGNRSLAESGFSIVGAHTDSPGLRIKPRPVMTGEGLVRLGVEIYGGPILATFSDRDLSLAGRISYKDETGNIQSRLIRFDQPLLRLPNLAIHMNRKVNEDGLKFHKQLELPLIVSAIDAELPAEYFIQLLEQVSDVPAKHILNWELNVYDTQKGCFWGDEKQFYANSQLDNLASCHAGLQALLNEESQHAGNTRVCAFFDHEEVGSESSKGANSSFLQDTLKRMALAVGVAGQDYLRALAHSYMLSIDMAHAWQPNFSNAYDAEHKVFINKGPVIKINANQRYTSESVSAAMFIDWCQQAGVDWQQYSHRTDLPCGSTIGPMLSARLGIRSIDVGSPMWAMHSIRESAGVKDHWQMTQVIKCFFSRL